MNQAIANSENRLAALEDELATTKAMLPVILMMFVSRERELRLHPWEKEDAEYGDWNGLTPEQQSGWVEAVADVIRASRPRDDPRDF